MLGWPTENTKNGEGMNYPPIPVFRWTGPERKALTMQHRLPDDDPEQMTLDASYGAAIHV